MSDLISLNIKITKNCFEKLKEQLDFAKDSGITAFENVSTVEELITKYLEQMSGGDEQFKQIQNKMQEVLQALNDKGIDMMDVFNSLNEKIDDIEKATKKSTSKKN